MRISFGQEIIGTLDDQGIISELLSRAETLLKSRKKDDIEELTIYLVDRFNNPLSWKEKKVTELLLLKFLKAGLITGTQRELVIKTLSLSSDIIDNPDSYIDYCVVGLLPKAELHVHLDGSVLPKTILEEHLRQGIPIDFESEHVEDIVSVGPDGITDFMAFLHNCFDIPLRIMQTREGLRRVAFEIVKQAYYENIFHIEPRFAPCLHLKQGLTYDEVMDAVIEGLLEGQARYGVSVSLIAGIYRDKVDLPEKHFQVHCMETAKAVVMAEERHRGKIELGFDIVGKEEGYPPSRDEFLEAFKYVKGHAPGVHITSHAGEMYGTAQNVTYVVANYGVERIGHGIQLFHDGLYGFERVRQIPFEVCPTSNVHLYCVESIERHPVFELIRQGFIVTINTDNRTASRTKLTDEIYKLLGLHGVELYQGEMISDLIQKLVINSIRSAFISLVRKEELLAKARREIELVNRLVAILKRTHS